jgi:cellulose synthase (UDP-forming)
MAFPEPAPRRTRAFALLAGLGLLALGLMCLEVAVRIAAVADDGYRVVDRAWAVLMLAADLFLAALGTGMALSVLRTTRPGAVPQPALVAPTREPVAILVSCFNETEDVVEQTLGCIAGMDYPAKHVYLVDDSTKAESVEAARKLADRYGATLVHRENRIGYKAGAINDLIPHLTEKYIALLDADSHAHESWLREVVPLMEQDETVALLQAPQAYGNLDLPVPRATSFQQAVFYEYICEGKSLVNAAFCCGTNVVLRRAALLDAEMDQGGRRTFFDESTVTEDFATTLRLHQRGWKTRYVNTRYVLGMGPETLEAYHTQQMRWALGTFQVAWRTLRTFLHSPRTLAPWQWWEYLLSCAYYLVGLVNFVFLLTPVLFLLAGLRPLRLDAALYVAFVLPYTGAMMCFFLMSMRLRGYGLKDVLLACVLSYGTFWTYTKALAAAVSGREHTFAVTPKGVGGRFPLKEMKMELALLAGNALAVGAGLARLVLVGWDSAYVINAFWAAYNVAMLGTIFLYFNRSITAPEREVLLSQAISRTSMKASA